MRSFLFAFLIVLTFSCNLQSQVCALKAGLYQERVSLQQRYDVEVGNDYLGHRSVADALLQRQRHIDKEYARFMFEAERNPGCCPTESRDVIGSHVCALSRYRASNRTATVDFLRDVPGDKQSATALWVLDEIAFGTSENNKNALPFAPYGPVQDYLSELFRLTTSGNVDALRKVLELYSFADGEYSESLEDQAEKLLVGHPEIVVSNWEIIKAHPDLLSAVREMMSDDLKARSVSKLQQQCRLLSRDCHEIAAALK